MNERIIALRKTLKLSQEEFGKKIGISKSGVSSIENNQRNVTDKHIKLLTLECNVNENWLRTGEGEMFIKPDDQFGAALGKIIDTDDEFIKEMFIGIANMSQADRDILKKAIEVIKKSNIF